MKLLNVSAWVEFGIFLFFLILLIAAAGFTLTTTQLLFMYGPVQASQIHYSWQIIWQLNNVANGQYSGLQLIAIIFSWILLAMYLMANSIQKWVKTGIAHGGIEIFCHGMIALDGVANWTLLATQPWYWQMIVVLGVYVALAHFGKIAIGHLQLAIVGFLS
jgi:hypothetical protein